MKKKKKKRKKYCQTESRKRGTRGVIEFIPVRNDKPFQTERGSERSFSVKRVLIDLNRKLHQYNSVTAK